MPRLKSIDSEIQITLQIVASRTETVCALRWNTPRSSASKASTKTLKPTHIQIDPIGLYLSTQDLRSGGVWGGRVPFGRLPKLPFSRSLWRRSRHSDREKRVFLEGLRPSKPPETPTA